ncbi:hypothetical protein CKAN_00437000 [Cinnamomum micranthum f. kanehirae]|uniref:Uncharacterized protein n=1 Tax=Cinnamomum micranthum f. kanehirae TaxID=337451 RepID=A0A443NBT4_9MAGN|nr:hypothetical protein CKAN_00437000 [Cinnamomum micranthum f. kanehirae]
MDASMSPSRPTELCLILLLSSTATMGRQTTGLARRRRRRKETSSDVETPVFLSDEQAQP